MPDWSEIHDLNAIPHDGRIVINCPTQEIERALALQFDQHGVRYGSGDRPLDELRWPAYGESMCYYIKWPVVWIGSKANADDWDWKGSRKYTFCEEPDETEIEEAAFDTIIMQRSK